MRRRSYALYVTAVLLVLSAMNLNAQQSPEVNVVDNSQESSTGPVPRLMRFSGTIKDLSGKPATRVAGVTFTLYKDQDGGAALWVETQNVQSDAAGRYTVMLGATKAEGLPADLFASGEARWLAVQPEGQAEQPRVLLVSVPYALKAADAETLGGKPLSAFVLATEHINNNEASSRPTDSPAPVNSSAPANPLTVQGSGTLNFLPIWTGRTTLGNSVLFQSAGKLGVGTTTPATTLDVKGSATIRGNLTDTGNISATGSVSGQTASFSGTTTGFGTAVLSVNQKGTTTGAISGFASATSGSAFGVTGFSSSPSGVGVSGEGGIGILGIGYVSSGGTGVSGSGKYGVQGTSSVSSGAGGVFSNTATGEALSAQINGRETFGVYPGATVVNGGGLVVGGNGASMIQGDPGCGSGFAGIGFSGLFGCNNYSLIGDGKSTYLNRPLGGTLFFRENNGDNMTIVPGGAVGVGTTSPNAKLDIRGSAGNSGLGIATDSNAWQARGANGWVKAMAYVNPFARGGIAITRCYNSQMTGAAVNTPPCGMAVNHVAQGWNNIDFGFEVDDRFVGLTPLGGGTYDSICSFDLGESCGTNGNQVLVFTNANDGSNYVDSPFSIFVY